MDLSSMARVWFGMLLGLWCHSMMLRRALCETLTPVF
jgi:hypothetical protein